MTHTLVINMTSVITLQTSTALGDLLSNAGIPYPEPIGAALTFRCRLFHRILRWKSSRIPDPRSCIRRKRAGKSCHPTTKKDYKYCPRIRCNFSRIWIRWLWQFPLFACDDRRRSNACDRVCTPRRYQKLCRWRLYFHRQTL